MFVGNAFMHSAPVTILTGMLDGKLYRNEIESTVTLCAAVVSRHPTHTLAHISLGEPVKYAYESR